MLKNRKCNYSITELVNEFNQELYKEITGKIEIQLLKSDDICWSAEINNNTGIIRYSKSNHPDAAFAHELLHIKYELNGLKQPLVINNELESVMDILSFLFNQLCHHKFYEEFINMGFLEEEFLDDYDLKKVAFNADRDIKALEKIYSIQGTISGSIPLLLPYLMLKSPNDNTQQSKKYIDRLKKIGDSTFYSKIDSILSDWKHQQSLDSSKIFARILKACGLNKIGFCLSGLEKDLIVAGNISE